MKFYADNNISVSPDKIKQQAEQARDICERLLGHIKKIEELVTFSTYFWNSDGANLLRKYFDEDKLDYVEIRKILFAQTEHLNKIAELYKNSENVSQADVAALPDTIIN